MEKIFFVAVGLCLFVCWLGVLIPQYFAWKNKRYKEVAVFFAAFVIGVAAFVAMIIYGDFMTALLYGVENSQTASSSELILCILSSIWGVSHIFCWWYVYGRKSLDYTYIDGYSADELADILSPEFRKLLGLK